MFKAYPHFDPNQLPAFTLAALPRLQFGWGIRNQLASHIQKTSQNPLFIVSKSVKNSDFGQHFFSNFDSQKKGETPCIHTVSGEPSPDLVDKIVAATSDSIDWVIGIGGGSVLDTAKAIAGLLPSRTSVMDYLEGVGAGKPYPGDALPWLAVPTTAGTGSETTKNAVLSRLGQFKKSFRHEALVAKEVWLDPSFLPELPRKVLHATAMDAFTQLLESYTTRNATPITDALAWHGMQLWHGALEAATKGDQNAWGRLMLAATLSGITLANAGLGAVHGLAGPIGAYIPAPHGEVCAALLAPVTRANLIALQADDNPTQQQSLKKYAQVGRLLTDDNSLSDHQALQRLPDQLDILNQHFGPGTLAQYGLNDAVSKKVVASCRAGSMLGNPVELSDEVLLNILKTLQLNN